ncbi:MAG: hypothetical protein HQ594_07005 [Candidatus Omnitrophica bacterium]|nr:hypothetical protein [Candidatus Omnitrophota bacterium]
MSYKLKSLIISVLLMVYVFGTTGCAAGWFFGGVGAGAAVAVAVEEAMKNKQKDKQIQQLQGQQPGTSKSSDLK